MNRKLYCFLRLIIKGIMFHVTVPADTLSSGKSIVLQPEVTAKDTVRTTTPAKAYKSGETMVISIPGKIPETLYVVPDSVVVKFSIGHSKSGVPRANLMRQLVRKLVIKHRDSVWYSNDGESVFSAYKDLWHTADRALPYFIKECSYDKTWLVTRAGDTFTIRPFSILNGNLPSHIAKNLTCEISLGTPDEVFTPLPGKTVSEYSLENLVLEYDTVCHAGTNNTIYFRDIVLGPAETLSRKAFPKVELFFGDEAINTADHVLVFFRDSEGVYKNPGVESTSITATTREGKSTIVTDNIEAYKKAKAFFTPLQGPTGGMSSETFLESGFCLVVPVGLFMAGKLKALRLEIFLKPEQRQKDLMVTSFYSTGKAYEYLKGLWLNRPEGTLGR